MNNQVQTFSFKSPKNIFEQAKWLLSVTSIEATNSVYNITNENNKLSISTPGHWYPEEGEEPVNKIKFILERRPQNDIKLHVKEFEKSGTTNRNRKPWI